MAEIGIKVVVNGVAEARRNIGAVQSDINGLERTIGKLSGTSSTLGQSLTSIGSAMVGVGRTLTIAVTAPIAAAGTAAIQAGINFEEAFAGVGKTVEGVMTSTGQLTAVGEQVRNEFRQMALDVPIATDELAKLGETVGQLGVSAEDVAGVTKLVAELGATTEISAEDAATGLIKFGNILEGASLDVEDFIRRAGSALVALGNTSVSTEGDILNLSLRLAAAGDKAKFTAPEIMAWATTLSDLGVRAEAGGSAVSRAITEMVFAVQSGSDNLGTFASVSHKTVQQFVKDFQEDASNAMLDFVTSLEEGIRTGKVTKDMLEDMGLSGVRAIDVMGRLGDATDIFAKNLATSQREWERAQALQEEFNKRAATTASMIQILKNQFTDLGITIFDLVKDDLVNLIKGIGDLVDKFKNLDPATQKSILSMLAFAATLGPMLIVVGGIIAGLGAVVTGIAALISPAGLAAAAIGGLALVIGTLAAPAVLANLDNIKNVALEVAQALGFIKDNPIDPMAQQAQQHGVQTPETGGPTIQVPTFDTFLEGIKKLGGPEITSALESLDRIGDSFGRMFDNISRSDALKKSLKEIGNSIGSIKDKLVDFSLKSLDGLADWFEENESNIATAVDTLGNFGSALANIADGLTTLAEPVATGVLTILGDELTILFDILSGDWGSLIPDMITNIQDLALAFGELGVAVLTVGTNAVGSNPDEFIASWQGNLDQLNIITQTWGENFRTVWSGNFDQLSTITSVGSEQVRETWRGNLDQMGLIATTVWDRIKEGASTKTAELSSTISTWWEGFKASWSGNWDQVKTIVSGVWDNIRKGVDTRVTALRESIKTAIDDAIKAAESAAEGAAGIGSSIIDGIVGGVNAGAGALAGAIRAAVLAGIAAGFAAAQSNSPSKIMIELGGFLMEGMRIGITDNTESAENAMTTATNSVIGSVMNALSNATSPVINNSTTTTSSINIGDITGVPISNEQNLVSLLSERVLAAGST